MSDAPRMREGGSTNKRRKDEKTIEEDDDVVLPMTEQPGDS